MRTREQLIARVLKNLGVLAAGESPSDEDRAEIDDLIEPICAKLLDDGVAKLNGDEIDDAAYLPLAAIIAETALVPFGIGGAKAAELRGLAEMARTDLKLAYRIYDIRPPLRIEPFWGRRGGAPPLDIRVGPVTPVPPPEDIDVDVSVDGGRRG